MKKTIVRIWQWALKHSVISLVLVAGVAVVSYSMYGALRGSNNQTRYVLAAAENGTLISSITGSGQVSVSSQLDIKPRVSGTVQAIPVTEGQEVSAGTLLIPLDSTDAQKAVRDAQSNLESAQLALKKITQPADNLSMIQAQNALTQAQQSEHNGTADLTKAYDDGFNVIANAFIDLPGVISGLDTILNGTTLNPSQSNAAAYYDLIKLYKPTADQFRDIALSSYQTARLAYDKNLAHYKTASRYSDREHIDALISETYETTKSISEAIKNTKSFLDLVNDTLTGSGQNLKVPAPLTTHETSAQSYTATANTHLGNLLNIKNTIHIDQEAIETAQRTIAEKTESLTKLKNGADPLDIQSQQLAVTQRQNALIDAQHNFADYFIRAPFAGIVAKISVNKADPASPGTSVVTLISSQKIVQISLNEVDVAKVKVGQKATLTFDAIADLTISGTVAQIDTIGTVTQGVVNYSVKISLDTQDERIKPGMSVSAAIITSVKHDVLLVPTSAVKSQSGEHYVEVLETVPEGATSTAQGVTSTNPPTRQTVAVGESNDTQTEITSGLSEGNLVITRAITASTQSQTQQTGGGLRLPGLGGGGLRQGAGR